MERALDAKRRSRPCPLHRGERSSDFETFRSADDPERIFHSLDLQLKIAYGLNGVRGRTMSQRIGATYAKTLIYYIGHSVLRSCPAQQSVVTPRLGLFLAGFDGGV
jgi:hypothetical protein